MSSNGISGQESLTGTQYHGVVVAIDFEGTEKRGEARVRIKSLHGDATETPDDLLPIAIFDIKNSTDNFGTFYVGDTVTVEYPKGGRNTPVIVGKTMNLESLKRVVPEYEASYGQVRGMYSPAVDCAIFINEATGSIHLRFVDGSDVEIKKGQVDITSNTLNVNIAGKATINAGSANVTVQGRADVVAQGPIGVTSAVKISISAPTVSINGM